MGIIGHNEDYWEMSIDDMVIQGLRRSCSRSYFNFMHNKPCFNLPHSQESMNFDDDIYHVQHLQEPILEYLVVFNHCICNISSSSQFFFNLFDFFSGISKNLVVDCGNQKWATKNFRSPL
jgi:hypothetical protein